MSTSLVIFVMLVSFAHNSNADSAYKFSVDPIYLNNKDGILCVQVELSSAMDSMPIAASSKEGNLRSAFGDIILGYLQRQPKKTESQRIALIQGKLPDVFRSMPDAASNLLGLPVTVNFSSASGGPKPMSEKELKMIEQASSKRFANQSGCFRF